MKRIEFTTESGSHLNVPIDSLVLWGRNVIVLHAGYSIDERVDDDEAARIRRVLNGEDDTAIDAANVLATVDASEVAAELRLRNAAPKLRRALQILCDCVRCELRAPTGLTQVALRDADAALAEAGDAT